MQRDLATAKMCCRSYAEFPYSPVKLEEPVEIDINSESPMFDFPEGRSFFAAFNLPREANNIEFMTGVNGIWLPTATVFMPQFLFLDESSNPMATVSEITVRQAIPMFEPAFGTTSYWSGRFYIPKGARKLVMYASAKRLGETITHRKLESGSVYLLGTIPVITPGGREITHKIPFSSVGSVKLRIRSL
jgi:maltose operon protein